MFKFLFIIFLFIVFLGLLLGFSVIRTLRFLLFGSNSRPQPQAKQKEQKAKKEEPQIKITRKVFNSEDGEYVDYEEIKE